MAVIKCKICGGDITLSEDRTFGVCEFCGSQVTLPKIDDDQRAAAFNRGNQFRLSGDFDRAIGVYEHILEEDDTDAEAHWCAALCRFGIEYVQDPASHEWLPTCHRLSFDSFLEDVDYLAALENSDGETRRQYEKDGAKIAEVQRGVLATSQNEDPYDVFICYKETDERGQRTRDSILAQDIYYQLTEKGWRVFFARITLEEHAGTEYEPYIFAALNSAKVMIVVGTRPEYLNAVWVKNEWSRFRAMMKKDRKKLLLPCYRDMDPYDLPEQLSMLQSYDMSKIGFIQDLIRGVGKVLDADKKPEPAVVVQQRGVGNSGALLKRGNLALEDGEWTKADEFFEEVLNQDAENADAYLGKALVESRCRSLDDLVEMRTSPLSDAAAETLYLPQEQEHIEQMVSQCSIPDYVSQDQVRALYDIDRHYTSLVKAATSRRDGEEAYWRQSKNLGRAMRFASGQRKEELESALKKVMASLDEQLSAAQRGQEEAEATAGTDYAAALRQADGQAMSLYEGGESRRSKLYEDTLRTLENSENDDELKAAAETFKKLGDYKDSADLAKRCPERIEQLHKQARWRKLRKRLIIVGLIVGLIAAVVLGNRIVNVTIPRAQYRKGMKLVEKEDYEGAVAAFSKASEYAYNMASDSQHPYYMEYFARQMIFRDPAAYDELFAQTRDQWDQTAQRDTIATSYDYLAAVKNDGTVLVQNIYTEDGDVPDVSDWTDIVEVALASDTLIGLRSDGTVLTAGSDVPDYLQSLKHWKNIVSIDAESGCVIGLLPDGTIIDAGSTGFSGTDEYEWTDLVAVKRFYNCVAGVRSDGTVALSEGAHYYDVNTGYYEDLTGVDRWTDVVAVTAGAGGIVGLRSDGTLLSAGAVSEMYFDMCNEHHVIGADLGDDAYDGLVLLYADTIPRYYGESGDLSAQVVSWDDVVQASVFEADGTDHVLALRADGTLLCDDPDIGAGWTDIRLPRTVVDPEQLNAGSDAVQNDTASFFFQPAGCTLASGTWHTAALLEDGTATAVGYNFSGQCDLEGWTDLQSVAAGMDHTLGLRTDGTVLAAGDNSYGQCNVSDWTDIVQIAAGDLQSFGVRSDGTVVATGSNDYGICEVDDWTDIVQVDSSTYYTLGLRSDGTVLAAGDNTCGQCDVSGWTDIMEVACGSAHAVGLRTDGTVVAAGDNSYGQCDVSGWTDVVAIAAGRLNTYGVRSDGTVLAVGDDSYGLLDPVTWNGIVDIASDYQSVIGLHYNGVVSSAGLNDDGQCDVGMWEDVRRPEPASMTLIGP